MVQEDRVMYTLTKEESNEKTLVYIGRVLALNCDQKGALYLLLNRKTGEVAFVDKKYLFDHLLNIDNLEIRGDYNRVYRPNNQDNKDVDGVVSRLYQYIGENNKLKARIIELEKQLKQQGACGDSKQKTETTVQNKQETDKKEKRQRDSIFNANVQVLQFLQVACNDSLESIPEQCGWLWMDKELIRKCMYDITKTRFIVTKKYFSDLNKLQDRQMQQMSEIRTDQITVVQPNLLWKKSMSDKIKDYQKQRSGFGLIVTDRIKCENEQNSMYRYRDNDKLINEDANSIFGCYNIHNDLIKAGVKIRAGGQVDHILNQYVNYLIQIYNAIYFNTINIPVYNPGYEPNRYNLYTERTIDILADQIRILSLQHSNDVEQWTAQVKLMKLVDAYFILKLYLNRLNDHTKSLVKQDAIRNSIPLIYCSEASIRNSIPLVYCSEASQSVRQAWMYISEQLGVDKRFFIDSLINDKVTVSIINKNNKEQAGLI